MQLGFCLFAHLRNIHVLQLILPQGIFGSNPGNVSDLGNLEVEDLEVLGPVSSWSRLYSYYAQQNTHFTQVAAALNEELTPATAEFIV
jgi:hypothetical protein